MLKSLKKIYSSRDVILRLAFTDLKLRYAGSYLGLLWSLLEPLLIILVYSLVFPLILKVNFFEWFLFFICGLIPYRYLRKGTMELTTSLVDYSNILLKSKMNPQNIIYAKAISTSISFLIELSIVFILVSFFVKPSFFIFLLPFAVTISFLLNLGLGFYFSVIYPRARDMNYILSIVFEALMFLTPIVYKIDHIPSLYRGIYLLNPIARLVYTYQAIFLYSSPKFKEYLPLLEQIVLLFLFSLFVFIIGYKKFEKEKEVSLELI